MEKIFTPDEAAEYLKIEPRTMRNYLREKKIIGFKMGKEWRILERDLVAFVEALRAEALASTNEPEEGNG